MESRDAHQRSNMAAQLNGESNHLTDDESAAYLDRGLSPSERDRIESHLALCPECRAQLVGARRVLTRVRRPKRSMVIASAVAALAATLIVLIRPAVNPAEQVAPARVVRGSVNGTELLAYGPTGETFRHPLRFVWSAAPGVATYRLSLSRGNGAPIWTQGSIDTAVALPDSVILQPGQRYFWVVDALLSDGGTRSTGLREFSTVP